MAVSEAIAVLDIMTGLPTPIAHLTTVLAPCMNGSIANGDLGSAASLALEIRSLVHVMVNAATNTGYGISGSKTVRTPVHGQTFILKRLF